MFGAAGPVSAGDVAVDGAGNVYVVGDSDGILPGQTDIVPGFYAYVRKYDSEGNELWTRQFGTIELDFGNAVAVDGAGNVYVAGHTAGGTLPGQTNFGHEDAFLRKYDSQGDEVWTRQFGTPENDEATGVAVDAQGSVYIGGITLGTLPDQTSAGHWDAYVRKYDPQGREVWTRQFGTAGDDNAPGLAADGPGQLYVAGVTEGPLPGQTHLGRSDAYLRKYDGDGKEIWTRQFGTPGNDHSMGLAISSDGRLYVAGFTSARSGLTPLPGQTYYGRADSFIRIYDADGNELWTLQFGTEALDLASGVAVDSTGKLYLSGVGALRFRARPTQEVRTPTW